MCYDLSYTRYSVQGDEMNLLGIYRAFNQHVNRYTDLEYLTTLLCRHHFQSYIQIDTCAARLDYCANCPMIFIGECFKAIVQRLQATLNVHCIYISIIV